MKTLDFISILLHNCKTAEPVENKSDYTRVKRWVSKATALYTVLTVIAIIITVAVLGVTSKLSVSSLDLPKPLLYVVVPFVCIFTAWGFAAMLMNFKLMIKSIWSAGVDGYRTGEQIQTNHVNVTHEYGNRYKVTTETENQGCVVAMINGYINLFVWAFLCVYVCPFLTFKKIGSSKKNLREFKAAQM